MTPVEALMWRLEQLGPEFRSQMVLTVTLDRPVDSASLVQRLRWVTGQIPRLRQRIAPPRFPAAPPTWELDPGFDLVHHLRRLPAAPADLLSATELLAAEWFDPEHPPWQIVVVDEAADGACGVILKLHHSYTDGLGAVHLAGNLFDLEARPAPASGNPAADMPPSPPFGWLDDLAADLVRAKDLLATALPWAGRTVRRALVESEQLEGDVRTALAAIGADLRSLADPGSYLLRGRSAAIRLAAIEVPLEGMRTAARRAGGTVNDVFVAALLGGLARYHDKYGPVPPSLRVGIPISTRPAANTDLSNQLQAIAVRGPLRLADPDERVRLVHEIVRRGRDQPYLDWLDRAAAIGARLPGAAEVAARLMGSLDLVASNLPGPPVELYLAGSRIEKMVPVGPRSGAAVNATLISYDGSAYVGVNADPAAAADFEVLIDCIDAGFGELV